ncbi:MAG: hypothetical protein GY822_04870 [Deltaproteobacteria bacterium]|nr:hypothetical protein [Deltaproteobacteria bacterium]
MRKKCEPMFFRGKGTTLRIAVVGVSLMVASCSPSGSASSAAPSVAQFGASSRRHVVEPSACQRKKNPFLIGANVVDIDDSEDKNLENDGLRGYGSKKGRQVLTRLRAMGANSLVLPVDIYVEKKGAALTFISSPLTTSKGQLRLRMMIRQAKEKELQVMLVPHLQLSDGTWRGDLSPPSIEDFLEQYLVAIGPILQIAEEECADAFSFAVEFKAMATRQDVRPAFALFIAQLRNRFSGTLSYSANWDEAAYVSFWPLLDVIGINAFFPLATSIDDSEVQIRTRVRMILKDMTRLSNLHQRPLVWWEVGYKATANALVQPWAWPVDGSKEPTLDVKTQLMAYDIIFSEMKTHSIPSTSSPLAPGPLAGLHVWMIPSDLRDVVHPWRFEPESGFSILNKPSEARFSMFAKSMFAK